MKEIGSADKKIIESEEKFKGLAEQSPNMIFINKKGRVVYVNNKCEEVVGYTKEEFYSDKFDFMSLIAPEFKEQVGDNFKKHMKGIDIEPFEYKILAKDKKELNTILTTKLIDYEGEKAILGVITDITDRKLAEQTLAESEEKYRLLIDNFPNPITFFDKNNVCIKINPAGAKNLGGKPDDFIGKSMLELFGDKAEVFIERNRRVIESGESVSEEDLIELSEGNKWFWSVLTPMKDSKGSIYGVQIISYDITERKKAEQTVLQEKNFSESVINSLPGVFYLFSDKLKFLKWNRNAEEVTGYSGEEISKMSPLEFFDDEDKKIVSERVRETFVKGKSTVEANFFTKGKKKIPHFFTGLRIAIDNVPCMAGLAIDITERKKIEEELGNAVKREKEEKAKSDAIVSSIGDALGIVDTNYRVIYQNQASKDMFGDHIGKLCYTAYRQNKQVCEGCPVAVSLKYGRIHRTERHRDTDNGRMYLEITASPLRDSIGEIIGGIEIVRDITERKRSEESLRIFAGRLGILQKIGVAALSGSPLEIIAQSALEDVRKLIPSLRASIVLFDFNARQANIIGASIDGKTGVDMGMSFSLEEFGLSENLQFGDIYMIDDLRNYSLISKGEQIIRDEGVRSFIRVPLIERDELLGSLNVGKDIPFGFTQIELNALREIADILAMVIHSKRTESSLKESEKKYRSIVDNALIGVYRTNLKGDILYANGSLANIFGFESPEKMMKESVLLRYKNPEDRDVLIENLRKTGRVANFEAELLTRTHETIRTIISATLLGDFMSGMIMDISDKYKLESALKKRVKDLEDFYDMAVGRELKMKALKEEIRELREELKGPKQ